MTKSKEESGKNAPKIFIIGAGFSGLCAGIKLQEKLGISNYTIFDENHDVGGTWLTHTYPGCACDVPSHLYSYSFELNPNWSTSYAQQPEILAYIKTIALKYDLYSKIKLHHQVKSLHWIESLSQWRVIILDKLEGTETEEYCDIIINGIGGLRIPSIPPQFLSFKGPVVHSAKWDPLIDLEDKTVAVIGSGCSAVQIIPTIEGKVKRLFSFQRRPAWVVPLSIFRIAIVLRWLFRAVPFLMWLYRCLLFLSNEASFVTFKADSRLRRGAKCVANYYLKWQIPNNEEKRKRLAPNYEFGCKRVSPSNVYYKALAKDKCDVIRDKITGVNAHSILTEDGREYPVDVLILATGYRVQDFFWPLKVYGKNSEDVLETWKAFSPNHYKGIVSSGGPNSFMILGPNTAYGHNSVIFALECQTDFIIQVLQEMMRIGAKEVSIRKDVEKRYMTDLRARLKNTVWEAYQCQAWYSNHLGINTTLYPNSLISYWNETRKANFSDFEFKLK